MQPLKIILNIMMAPASPVIEKVKMMRPAPPPPPKEKQEEDHDEEEEHKPRKKKKGKKSLTELMNSGV
jgi:hypothetical protein